MANKKNLPYIPLYTGDWEKDCNVLSLEAEAAWLRIIFKMFNSGKQSVYKIPTKALQNLWRVNTEKMNDILQELTDNDICGIEREERFITFTSRRYERENAISEIRRQAVAQRKDRKSNKKNDTNGLQSGYKTDTNHIHNTEYEYEYDNDIEDEIILKEKKEKTDFNRIMDSFNSICISLPKIKSMTDRRKKKINTRLKDLGGNVDLLEDIFHRVEASDFLTGRIATEEDWIASFDWIFKNQDNLAKIIEGNYDNKGKPKQSGHSRPTTEELAAAVEMGTALADFRKGQ